MKRTLFALVVCTTLFSACSKTDNSNSKPNTITLHDNGANYTMTSTSPASSEDVVNVTLEKSSGSSQLIISAYNTSSNKQFSLQLNAFGSYTGIGQFNESLSNTPSDMLTEYFQNGQTYQIDSASINVSASTSTYIAGTYTLFLSNAKGTNSVYGSFSANNPVIE